MVQIRFFLAVASCRPDGDDFRDVVTLILNTGITCGELLHLRWSDVDLTRSFLNITSASKRQLRSLRFGERTGELLRRRFARNPHSDLVLGPDPCRVIGRISRELRRVSADVSDHPITLMGIQHAFAYRLLESFSESRTAARDGHSAAAPRKEISSCRRITRITKDTCGCRTDSTPVDTS